MCGLGVGGSFWVAVTSHLVIDNHKVPRFRAVNFENTMFGLGVIAPHEKVSLK